MSPNPCEPAGLELQLVQAALAPSSRDVYRHSVKRLKAFLSLHCPGKSWLPLSRALLAKFITHLFALKYAASTITVTVSAVSYAHNILGFPDPADCFYIKKLLKGAQNLHGSVDIRRPIDATVLSKIVASAKHIIPCAHMRNCITAMYVLAFLAFLRVGEITVDSRAPHPGLLQLRDLKIVRSKKTRTARSVQLTIRYYKHSQPNKPALLQLKPQPALCPVAHLLAYLQLRGLKGGPLFIFPDGRPITRAHFTAQLRACLRDAALDSRYYKGHSFRIGAATTAAERGCSESQIQAMGRWRSNAFRRYIRIPMLKV